MAQQTPRSVINCLKTGTTDDLTNLVQKIGTDFLKAKKSLNIRDLEIPVVAYYCAKENPACVTKALELEPQANLSDALRCGIEASSLECIKLVLEAHRIRGDTPEAVSCMQLTGGLRMIIFAGQLGVEFLKEVCEHEAVGMGEYFFNGKNVLKDRFINQSPLDSVRSGACVDYLCTKWKQDPNNGEKETECDRPRPLHRAVARESADVIDRLIANGAHVQAQTVNGTTVAGKAIHVLCCNQKMSPFEMLASLRTLVANGADPAAPSLMERKTPLAIALQHKIPICVDYLTIEAKVSVNDELSKFAADAIAKSMLEAAIAKRDAGATVAEVSDSNKRLLRETVELFEWSGKGEIRSGQCRLHASTKELTSQDEFRPEGSDSGLAKKAEKAALCLHGESLQSDGSYPWLAFWAMPDPNKRPSRRDSGPDKFKSTLFYALGSNTAAQKSLKVVKGTDSSLLEHLSWEPEESAGDSVALDSITEQSAAKLDRGDRLSLLKQVLGTKELYCGKFDDAVSFPVFIAGLDETSGGVFGVFSTRVDT